MIIVFMFAFSCLYVAIQNLQSFSLQTPQSIYDLFDVCKVYACIELIFNVYVHVSILFDI